MAFSSLALPELKFLSPKTNSIHRLSLSKQSLCRTSKCRSYPRSSLGHRTRIRAVKEDNAVVEEKTESELIKDLNGLEFNDNRTGNGAAGAPTRAVSGSVNGYANGSANGSLVKYVNGNGLAVGAEVVGEVEVDVDDLKKEEERKKKVEQIGREEAWFKKSVQEKQIEVSVATGGRWSRFKTYSTIQRTLEIWGFVLKFIFKAWLNNQKFTYRGQSLLVD